MTFVFIIYFSCIWIYIQLLLQGLLGTSGCPGTSAVTLFSAINNLIFY